MYKQTRKRRQPITINSDNLKTSRVSTILKNKGKPTVEHVRKPRATNQSPYTDTKITSNIAIKPIITVPKKVFKPSNNIPKKMSFFWAGKTMSWLRFMTIYSFSTLNPEWEVILYHGTADPTQRSWTCPNMQDFLYPDMDDDYFHLVARLPNVEVIEDWSLIREGIPYNKSIKWDNLAPVHKCDILEWKILAEEGGFFADFDILFIRPMDKLFNDLKRRNIQTGFCYQNLEEKGTKYFSIGFLCSNVVNKFYDDIYKWAITHYDPTKYQSTGAFVLYCLLSDGKITQRTTNSSSQELWLATNNLEKIIKYKYPYSRMFNFEMNTVYPYTWRDLHELYVKNNVGSIPRETIGLHWYGGSEASQMFNRSLTQGNWRDYNNTICNAMEKFITFDGKLLRK